MIAEIETDAVLLERFARHRDEAAFEVVVGRHAPMVLSTCRQILRNEHDIEDVGQATFLLLARKAAEVRWDHSIEGWLRSAARRLAMHSRARSGRSRYRELPLETLAERTSHSQIDPGNEIDRREVRRLVNAALLQLPEKYRAPVVLCYLHGQTNEEAARQLGWPAGSMSRRLKRAKVLLRRRLSRVTFLLVVGLVGVGIFAERSREAQREALTRKAAVHHAMQPLGPQPRLDLIGLATANREQVMDLARTSAHAARALLEHDPADDRGSWMFESARMLLAANELTQAAGRDDSTAMLAAARRLDATCVRCHEVFRH